jgi:subtilisin family serine protease
MRGRSGWFGLLAVSAALAACNDGSTTSEPESEGPAASPGERITPSAVVEIPAHVARDLYFVQLEEEPTSRGGRLDRLDAERARFHSRARLAGVTLSERYAYTRLWNGLSVKMTADQIAALRAVDGVKAVFPVHTVTLDDVPNSNVTPDLFTALAMTGADIAQNTLGLTGAKVLVGVIDSGIDYNHPDLGGCFGAGCRVAMGHDFVGDSYDANNPGAPPQPDNDPDDCGGHGTHVSGIIGANGLVKGVAPAVTFGAYRVFGCAGSAGTDVILKAMETAAADGMRVVNMSLGSSFAWPEAPEAQAANQLVKDGVVVVASIGNSGANGLWAAGAPGNGDLVIGTASVENTAIAGPAFQISPHDTMAGAGLVGFNSATGAPPSPITGSFPVVRTGTITSATDGCKVNNVSPLPPGSLTGSIVLIRRGGCTFFEKASNAMNAGAAGAILYNNAAGALNPTVAGTPAITIPVVALTAADSVAINTQMDSGAVTLTWGTNVATTVNTLANTLSSFSSFGLTAELGFKPDIAAPGGSIYSTWPLELGAYASLSGTSMASPHVAGTVALLLQARPGLSATDGCKVNNVSPLPPGSLTGSVVLIRRGGCTFFEKASNAMKAGAAGAVLYNNAAGALNPTVAGTPAITIPVVAITAADGVAINTQMDSGAVTLGWGTNVATTVNTLANTLSSFSSFGLTAELGFKPDIAAPGGSIYSTWPIELGSYASLSGTSMASPHLAGTVALLLQARSGLSATEVRDILQNNAVPEAATAPNGTVAENVHRQGAGIVQIVAAVQNLVRATPGKIALGESQAGPVTTKIAFTNDGATAVTYDITHVPALSTTGTTYAPASVASGYATAQFDVPTLTVPAGGTATVSATITADPTLADGGLYGGYLVFTPQGAGAPGVIRVPYSGFKGDYQGIQILVPTSKGYPWLANSTGTNQPNGATFTLQSGDTPRIIAHFDHAARQVRMDVFEATKMKAWGRALTEDYYPQNSATVTPTSTANATYTFGWNGTTVLNKTTVKVPNGKYVIKLSVLKALGDTNNPADWEVWTSPAVTLNHP